MTDPKGSINEAERNRSHLLEMLPVTLLLLLCVVFILTMIFNPAGSIKRVDYCVLIAALAILLATSYILNLSGR